MVLITRYVQHLDTMAFSPPNFDYQFEPLISSPLFSNFLRSEKLFIHPLNYLIAKLAHCNNLNYFKFINPKVNTSIIFLKEF